MNQRFPFTSFPSGWFRIAYSDELPPKKVMPLHYFGKDLVLLRTEDGTPCVFDAYCPHLGAHLGHGGQVEGNNIRCPFHGWSFNSQGHCVDVPSACKVMPNAQLRAWPVHEVNGLIMVYYDAQGNFPTWTMPEFRKWNPKEWTPFKRHRWKLRTHVQEIMENGIDTAHFLVLHGSPATKEVFLEVNGPILLHRILLKYNYSFIRKLGIEGEICSGFTSDGLGQLTAHVNVKGKVEFNFLTVLVLTPIDQEYVELHLLCSIKKLFSKVATHALLMKVMSDNVKAIDQDVPIWENKVYRTYPLLCDGDGPIAQYRRWARQFYSYTMPTIPTTSKTPLEATNFS